MPQVSVIIPTYNRARLICRAVDSALSQDHPSIEILVVDDGSIDDTREVIQAAYGRDPRVRYLAKANGGVSSARNLGLKEAQGEFIAFLDADDAWLPGKLRLQLAVLENVPEAGMVWTDMAAVDGAGQVLHPRYLRKMYSAYRYFPTTHDLFAMESVSPTRGQVEKTDYYAGPLFSPMVLGNLVHTSTVLLRRSRQAEAGFFDERYRTGEDYPFHLQTCRFGSVAYLDAVTLHYTIGEQDALTASKHLRQASLNFLQTFQNSLSRDSGRIRIPRSILRARLAQAYAWVGQTHLEAGLNFQARRYYLMSVLTQPSDLGSIRGFLISLLPNGLRNAARMLRKALRTRLMHINPM